MVLASLRLSNGYPVAPCLELLMFMPRRYPGRSSLASFIYGELPIPRKARTLAYLTRKALPRPSYR